ncbi:MAG: radical SAM protein, partial [Pseudomonadota bacterium]
MNNRLPDYLPVRFQRIHLELTNSCNFSCLFCPDRIMTRPRGFIKEDLARSALRQIAELDLCDKVTFHVMGEPLLHPGFFGILDYASQVGLRSGVTTNGALLKPNVIEGLAGRDLHQIDISLQSPDGESFSRTRGSRVRFDTYRQGLLDLVAACMSRPSPPIFKVRIMITRFARALREQLGIPDFLGDGTALRRAITEWSLLIYDRLGISARRRDVLLNNVKRIKVFGWNVIEVLPKMFIETYVLTDWGNAFAEGRVFPASHGYCFGMR